MSKKIEEYAHQMGPPHDVPKELLMWNSKDAPTNPRGIPYAPFVDKVEDYVVSRAEVDGTMKSFQEMISYALIVHQQASLLLTTFCIDRKYQFMEINTQRRAAGLKEKIPDIQKTLDMVQFLKMRKVCLAAWLYSPYYAHTLYFSQMPNP